MENLGVAEPDNTELDALLSRCARQDHSALEELYRRVSPLLLGLLLRILRSRDVAEDALQDVFVRVWLQAGQYEAQRGRALAWMTSIARYRAIDIQRGRRNFVGLEAVSERSASAVRPESTLTQRSLERCLALLSGDQRHCLVLAYQQGLTQDHIAASMGYPLGTVKSWVRRALFSLRRCLDS
jgi:RNA polymerase sigma-70 factor, ECF subfamily